MLDILERAPGRRRARRVTYNNKKFIKINNNKIKKYILIQIRISMTIMENWMIPKVNFPKLNLYS